MTPDPSPPPLEALLAHRAWVRALAARIARGGIDADDLEQDAWLAAARARPSDGSGIRAWFGRVIRNRAAERRRGDAHREAREGAAARPEGVPGAAALVAEAEAHGRVVQAVLALEEPYRGTVLLRFYEGLPPRAIAERTGVPVETVRTRLRRAAEALRSALGGSRSDWLGALAPLVPLPIGEGAGTPHAAAGGVVMKASTAVAAGAVGILVVGGTAVWSLRAPPAEIGPSSRATGRAGAPGSGRPGGGPGPRPETLAAGPGRAESTGPRAPPAPAVPAGLRHGCGRITGRVLLPDGSPAAGAAVGGPGAARWMAADSEGRFAVDLRPPEEGGGRPVWVALPGYRATGAGPFPLEVGAVVEAPDVRLEPDRTVLIRGRVVSRGGGAEVPAGKVSATTSFDGYAWKTVQSAREPTPLLMLGAALPGRDSPEALREFEAARRAEVRPGGEFEMRVLESFGAFTLCAEVPGFSPGYAGPRHTREWEGTEVGIEVAPLRALRGTVVDGASGDPVEGASVTPLMSGAAAVRTDAEGAFEVARPDGDHAQVRVTAPGFLDETVLTAGDGAPLTVRLSRRTTLTGVLRLPDGSPVSGASVWYQSEPPTSGAGGGGSGRTDASGRFEFRDVRAGSVTLGALPLEGSSASFLRKTIPGVAAGAPDVEFVVEPALSIGGIVVDEAGLPVAGISVGRRYQEGPGVFHARSREDGSFVVPGFPPGRHDLGAFDGSDRTERYLTEAIRGVEAGTGDLRIVVRRGLAITGRVVDEDGRPVFGRSMGWRDAAADPLPYSWGGVAELDSEGRFSLSGLAPGRYRLGLDRNRDPVRMWLLGGEAVEAGAKDLVLTLTSGGTLAGEVVDGAGEPVKGAWVSAVWTPESGNGVSVRTDERGRFEIRGLPPGRSYAIRIGNSLVEREIAVGTRDLRLTLPPPTK